MLVQTETSLYMVCGTVQNKKAMFKVEKLYRFSNSHINQGTVLIGDGITIKNNILLLLKEGKELLRTTRIIRTL